MSLMLAVAFWGSGEPATKVRAGAFTLDGADRSVVVDSAVGDTLLFLRVQEEAGGKAAVSADDFLLLVPRDTTKLALTPKAWEKAVARGCDTLRVSEARFAAANADARLVAAWGSFVLVRVPLGVRGVLLVAVRVKGARHYVRVALPPYLAAKRVALDEMCSLVARRDALDGAWAGFEAATRAEKPTDEVFDALVARRKALDEALGRYRPPETLAQHARERLEEAAEDLTRAARRFVECAALYRKGLVGEEATARYQTLSTDAFAALGAFDKDVSDAAAEYAVDYLDLR